MRFDYSRVDTEQQFAEALAHCSWDVVLADYKLPSFTGIAALQLASRLCPDVPLIIVSGVLGEEVAIDTLKTGATDYVLKDRLDRLAPAIHRAMAECSERRQRREAQAALLESESRLRTALLEAEQANAAKDQFLAALSHELRTPLTPILTTVQILSFDSTLSDDQRDQITIIRRNVELEARLIDDLLDLTRIVHNKVQLQEQAVDVHHLAEGVIDICRDDLVARQQVLERHFGATRATVSGDVARLQQVLWNLLKNAIKFTPFKGRVQIYTRNPNLNGVGDAVQIVIEDNGIGIDASALPKIFAPFEQADTAVTRRFGGLGLGLSIAKRLAEKHGGTLVAESEGLDRGSRFTLTLPVVADTIGPTAAPASVMPPTTALSILLVEDHGDTGRAMSRLLRMLSHRVRLAVDSRQGIAAIDEQPFDLLISDIGLPDGSGLDVVQYWRKVNPQAPAIALTGYGMDHDVDQCRKAGFNEHITKPVNFEKLESVIRSLQNSMLSHVTD